MDGAVGTHGQSSAQGVFAFFATQRHGDDFTYFTRLFKAYGFFHRNFVKRVHRHFDVADVYVRAIGLYPHFDVVIHHALYGDQCFHWNSFRLYFEEIILIFRLAESNVFTHGFTQIAALSLIENLHFLPNKSQPYDPNKDKVRIGNF